MKIESIVPDSELNPPNINIEMNDLMPTSIYKVGKYQRRKLDEEVIRIYQNPFLKAKEAKEKK
jgi:hypothetical protein